ncbi:EAL domain-containing protein [Buttiauxella gaviniae]|uniref:EAL domain-containing protein n=1 Tax=Buttiauxella gaviniae TaxID=82990 RepID=A0ABV3NTK1_9ENTR
MRVSRSLTIKQMAMVSAVAVLFIFIFIVVQLFHFVQQSRYDTASQMEKIAHSVRIPLSAAILKADIPQAESILNQIQPSGIISRADVVLPNQFQALRQSFAPERPIPMWIARLFELPVQISLPLYSLERPANPQPLAYLVLQADSWRMYKFIISTISTLLTTYLLLALILSVAISWSINRLIVHPIRNIARELDSLNPNDAASHQLKLPHLHHDDEIGMLVRSYNRNQQMSQRHLTEEHDLLTALDNHQFAIWLQPQVNMQTREVVSAEVLLRMKQPDGSWTLPDDLIPRIENCGLIFTIGNWVLEESCRVLARWQSQGITMPLCVNISAHQLLHEEMGSSLLELLARYRIQPGMLILEVTESHRIDDPKKAVSVLRPLRKAGVRIALDDFGMGYASLRHLHHLKALPVDALKLDKSFVDGLPEDHAMAGVIIGMAKTLGLKLVAEGIENQAQCDWLLKEGVTVAQGYLFSRALTLKEFDAQYLSATHQ